MTSRLKLALTFAAALTIAGHIPAAAQDNSAQNNGDFLAGILGKQVPTNEGQDNGGQTGNQSPDSSDEFRLGIFRDGDGIGDTAEAGESEGGGGGGGAEAR